MGVFSFFKKGKPELSDEEKRLNQMWALWAEGRADSPWREVMTYQGEVNNGGHDQYFLNIGNTGDLQKEMAMLETVLQEKLQSNLQKAYAAYRVLSEKESDERGGGHKKVISYFLRNGVASVTPFPVSEVLPRG